MSVVAGELWVEVKPLTTGFGAQLEKDVSASSREAGVVAGRSAGAGFAQGFRSEAGAGAAIKSELGNAERGAAAAGLSFRGLGRAVAYASGTFLAVGGLVEGIRSSIRGAADLQGNLAIVERQIRNVGAANEVYGKSVEDQIRANALSTGFSENDLLPAFGRLISATHDTAKSYRDLGLAEDVARARHIGVAQAALALSKAEAGSITSLQRLGIIVPAYAKNLDAAQKATAALAIVQNRFGGTAAAFAETSAGSLARLNVASEVLKETIGSALLPEVQHLADGLTEWFSKSQNLEKVQRDVATVAGGVEGAFKGLSEVVKVLKDEFGPLIDALGGVEKASELVFGAIAVRKIAAYGSAIVKASSVAIASLTATTGATAREAAATTAATVASERQIAVYGARGEVLTTVTVEETSLAAATTAEGDATAAASGRASFGLIGGGLGRVGAGAIAGRAGLAGAALVGGYALGSAAIDQFHLRKPIEDFGASVEKFGASIGLFQKGVDSSNEQAVTTRLARPSTQAALRADYQNVQKITTTPFITSLGQNIDPKERAALIDQARKAAFDALKTGFTYHDAAVFAGATASTTARAIADNAAFTHQGADLGHGPGTSAPRGAPRPTDTDYQIAVQRALLTQSNADEDALYQDRARYIAKRIAILEADNHLGAQGKKTLLALETQQVTLQQQIQSDAAANVSKLEDVLQRTATIAGGTTSTADDKRAAAALLSFYEEQSKNLKLTADARAQYADKAASQQASILQADQQTYTSTLSFHEAELNVQLQRAQLTQDSFADDRKAQTKLLDFYKRESQNAKLTLDQRRTYLQDYQGAQDALVTLDQQAYQQELSNQEQRLQIAAQRAQLTAGSIADDRKAAYALLKFYEKEAHDAKLTEAQRLQYQSQAISERLTIKGTTPTATAGQIFAEAATEFATYGSNIGGRNAILSEQDARAGVGRRILQGSTAANAAARAVATRHREALTEAQKQTALLAQIAASLEHRKNGPANDATITRARKATKIVGAG